MEVAKSDPGNSLSGAGSTSDSAAKTIRQVGSTDQAKGEVDSLFTDTFGNPELPTVKYRSVFIPDRRTMGWCVCDPKLLSLISKPSENTNLTQEAADEMSDAVEYMLRIVSHLKQYTRKERGVGNPARYAEAEAFHETIVARVAEKLTNSSLYGGYKIRPMTGRQSSDIGSSDNAGTDERKYMDEIHKLDTKNRGNAISVRMAFDPSFQTSNQKAPEHDYPWLSSRQRDRF